MMAWLPRAMLAASLLPAACIGEPELFSCDERPDLPGCGTSSATETTGASTGDDGLPPAGICYREPLPLTWVEGGGEFTVGNGRFEMTLAQSENFMPRRLAAVEAGSENLLYAGAEDPERLIGVQLHPFAFSWSRDGVSEGVVAWERGGAVVRFSIDWEAGLIGSHYATRYTITPDGRMTRDESVFVAETPTNPSWLNAYVALDANRFDRIEVLGDRPGSYAVSDVGFFFYPDEDPIGEQNLDQVVICAHDSETGIAVAIGGSPGLSKSDDGSHPPMPGGFGWGFRATHPLPASIGLQLDWGRDFLPTPTAYYTRFMQMVTTDLEDPCGCIEEQFHAYVDPPPLGVEGGMTVAVVPGTQEGEGDEMMDGYYSDGGYYAVVPTANPVAVKVTERAVPTMLLRVVGVTPGEIEANMDGVPLVEGRDYLATPSNDPAQGFFFFLARSLPPEVVLQIDYD